MSNALCIANDDNVDRRNLYRQDVPVFKLSDYKTKKLLKICSFGLMTTLSIRRFFQKGVSFFMKLNYPRTFIIGLAFFSITAFWQLYDHVVPLILKYTFDANDALAGGIMAMDNIVALVMLPLFGALSDKTRTRWGRRMPYIVLGGFSSCFVMLSIPLVNNAALQGAASLGLFIAVLGLTLLLMSTYRSCAVALMPDVTVKPLRSKANAVINLTGAIGGIFILVLINLLVPGVPSTEGAQVVYTPNYLPVFLGCMGIMAVAIIILMLRINEPSLVKTMHSDAKKWGIQQEDTPADAQDNDSLCPNAPPSEASPKERIAHKKSTLLASGAKRSMILLLCSIAFWFMGYNAITTSFSKYCVERFGMGAGASALVLMLATGAAILSYIPVGILATRIGRKRCIQGGVLLLAAAFGIGALFTEFNVFIYPIFIAAGVAWAAINVNSYPMVVEMTGGADVGKFTGYYYAASMSAQVLTPILSGAALQYIGYETLFPYGALFVGLSFVTLLFVRHGDSKPLR